MEASLQPDSSKPCSILALTPATKYRPFNMQMMSQGHKALRAPAQSTLI